MAVCSRLLLNQSTYCGGQLDVSQGPPGFVLLDQLGLVQADRGFRQGVVEGIPDDADRGVGPGLDQVGSEHESGALGDPGDPATRCRNDQFGTQPKRSSDGGGGRS
jgi:hypothetical protein